MFFSLRGAVLSFGLMAPVMALAYGQVNASFYRVGVSGDQSSSWLPVKQWSAGLLSVQCSPRGMANWAKTRLTENN
jgi:hypothetical protein